ncbi:ThiF family adenylyltransferase [Nostoc sp. KVJ3]|uniref:ThiF family adenylyltransferase n=1 Tax=Nostoc sp. KVJ3 TaxID=457945 RepID=UPI002237042E|nr:ThiF family adenylyltransferase [Nostoc sp. KVJ3]MCW5318679.1 ThiF family adenylyltransferase [Nostoc sp. KVJ3]
MSQPLISHSPDLQKLRNEGFDIQVKSTCLLVKDVPYVNANREVKRGILISKLTSTIAPVGRPADHTIYFQGEHPCDSDGNKLEAIANSTQSFHLGDGVDADHKFSAKPMSGYYENYYAKVTSYVDRISDPAAIVQPGVTAKTFAVVEPEDESSVFQYDDTSSTRAEITDVTNKLKIQKLAIIGLGGTGSYVLDMVAKTPVNEIHLYDKDLLLQHNAFRAPGAPSAEELHQHPYKVDYYKSIYSKMHKGVIAHPYHITGDTVSELRDMQMVFICMDKASPKQVIVEKLEEFGIPFIDVGMGVVLTSGSLGGILSVTLSTPQQREHVRENNRISFADGDAPGEYNTNIQIADLNAFNAVLAVIKWKKLCGFYHDHEHEHHSSYLIGSNKVLSEDKA